MESNILIILGTAHLGTTLGKCSPDGKFKEAEYSRELVAAIRDRLLNLGYDVTVDWMPIDAPKGVAHPESKTQQSRELSYRSRRVNELCVKHGTDNCLYISVHVNAAGGGYQWLNAGGWSCFTTIGKTKSDSLAEHLYQAAEKHLANYAKIMETGKQNGSYGKSQKPIRKDMTDGDSDQEKDLYVLKNTKCAAVLTENLFMDNKCDVAYLMTEEGFRSLVELHVEGISEYIKEFFH